MSPQRDTGARRERGGLPGARPRRDVPRALVAGGLGFAVALLLAACGSSSGLLSAQQASTLDSQLSTVAAAIDSNHCSQAGAAAQAFDNAVSNLPSSVNRTLTNNLKQASAALASKAEPDCENSQHATIPTTTKTTPAAPTTTTPTTNTAPTTTGSPTTGSTTSTSPATTGTSPGSTSTSGGSGGAGVGSTSTPSNSGGAPAGNGNGQ